MFLGSTALVEKGQMSIAYIGGSTRIVLIIGLIVFVCFHVRRAFENREVEVMLSRPISRSTIVFAYWLGFSLVSVLLILPLLIAIHLLISVNVAGLYYWGMSLMFEAWLVIGFALFASLILRSAVISVILCFGFYFLSRMMGFFMIMLARPGGVSHFDFGVFTEKMLSLISVMIPRLDLYAQTKWLIYGIEGGTHWVFIPQSLIFVPFLLSVAIFDFKRKQF